MRDVRRLASGEAGATRSFACLFVLQAFVQAAAPAAAQDCSAPCAGYEISIELQNDLTFPADRRSAISNILQPSISTGLFVLPAARLGLVAVVTTETVDDPAIGESAYLDGVGSFIEELYAVVEADAATVRVGKFDPIFSLAGEVLPGINSTALADAIDADERLGGETNIEFDAIGLNQRLTASAFTTDRSVLGGSVFAKRERISLADGGAGNTSGLSSFSTVLSGCSGAATGECYDDGQFGYQIAVRYQNARQTDDEEADPRAPAQDELAYLAGATRNIEYGDLTIKLLGETAYLKNIEGSQDDALVVTGSVALALSPVIYLATYSQQRSYLADEPDSLEHLADFEAIYVSEEGSPSSGSTWEVGAAYTYASDADVGGQHIFSMRLTFDLLGEM